MAEWAASQRSKRRANRRGITTGFLIGIGVLSLFHHIGIRIGMLPFARFGGPHWISFAQPTTARLWLREIIATLLIISSPFLPFRFGDLIRGIAMTGTYDESRKTFREDAVQFRFSCMMTLLAWCIYLVCAVCLGSGI
jgi:hypothetical protein